MAQDRPTTGTITLPIIRFSSSAPAWAVVGREYRYQAVALGRDAAAAIRYQLTTAASGAVIDSLTGVVRWTTSATAPATVRFTIRAAMATNASQNVSQNFTVNVLPASAGQPLARFASTPPGTASVGVQYVYQAFAYYGFDSRLAPLPMQTASPMQYSLIDAPQGMAIDATRGTVRWLPSQGGTVQFSIRAVSATVASASTTQAVTLRISEPRPAFISNPPGVAFVGQEYVYTAIVVLPGVRFETITSGSQSGSPAGGAVISLPIQQRIPMTYTLLQAPAGMTVSTAGVVRWTPTTLPTTLPTTGTVRVSLRASVIGGSTTQTVTQDFTLRVSQPQMLFTTQPPRETRVGAVYTYQPYISYGNVNNLVLAISFDALGLRPAPSFQFSLVAAPQGMTIDATRGTVRWTPTTGGTVSVSIRAALASNPALTTTQSYQINVAAPPQSLVFTSAPGSVFIEVGREFVYRARAEATQPTTATVVYSLGAGTPSNVRIDSLTGELRWMPSVAGEFPVVILARLRVGNTAIEARQAFLAYVRAVICASIQGVARSTDGTVIAAGTARALVTTVTSASQGGSPFFYTATIRNGVYSMAVGAGSYILSFSGADFADTWFGGNATNTTASVSAPDRATVLTIRCGDTLRPTVVIQRRPAARFFAISGRVTQRSNNAPVVATIEVVGDADENLISGGIIRRTARSDAQGNYRVTQLDNRYIYTVRALPDEMRSTVATVRPVQLLPQYFENTQNLAEARRFRLSSDLTNINFALVERPVFNNSIAGNLRSSTGGTVLGRVIAFMTATTANTPQYASLDIRTETTDNTGSFSIANLTPGEYVLQAFPNDERSFASGYYVRGTTATTRWREASRVTVGATGTERVTIALASRRSNALLVAGVAGNVSNEAGLSAESVHGASVYLVNDANEVIAGTLTDKYGNFDVGLVEHGTFSLIVDKPGYQSTLSRVQADKPMQITKSLVLQKEASSKPTTLINTMLTELMTAQNTSSLFTSLRVSPNPVNESALVQIPAFEGLARLSVVNMRGEEVLAMDISTPNTALPLDVRNLPQGVYFVRLSAANLRTQAQMLIVR